MMIMNYRHWPPFVQQRETFNDPAMGALLPQAESVVAFRNMWTHPCCCSHSFPHTRSGVELLQTGYWNFKRVLLMT